MKALSFFCHLSIVSLTAGLLLSCSTDSNPASSGSNPQTSGFSNTPEAKSDFDTSSGGVYKGVIVNPSGTFKLALKNGNSLVTGLMKVGNDTASLSCNSLSSWTSGTAVSNAVFSGSLAGNSVAIGFSVLGNGSSPAVIVTIQGVPGAPETIESHAASISATVSKELSTSLVKGYEGTWKTNDANNPDVGEWNFLIHGNALAGNNGRGEVTGAISGSTITGEHSDGTFNGTLNGDNVSGTFEAGSITGTWSGKRTL